MNNDKHDIKTLMYIINNFFLDSIEIFIITFIYKIISGDKNLTYLFMLRNSMILGSLFTVLTVYNESMKTSIKQGVMVSMGATVYRGINNIS